MGDRIGAAKPEQGRVQQLTASSGSEERDMRCEG